MVYKVKDIFSYSIFYAKEYKKVKADDFTVSEEIEMELENLKKSKNISDFFYEEDFSSNLKIYYELFEHFENFEKTWKGEKFLNDKTVFKEKKKNVISNGILCEKCNTEISFLHVNTERNIAYCPVCKSLKRVEGERAFDYKLDRPDLVEIEEKDNELVIKIAYHKRRLAGIFFIPFLVILVRIYLYNKIDIFRNPEFKEIINYFLVIGGIITFYSFGLVTLVNKLVIRFKDGILSIKSIPLPYFPRKTIDLSILKEFYVDEVEVIDLLSKSHNSYEEYVLYALFKDSTSVEIIKFPQPEYPIYLEYVIENYLGIKDGIIDYKYLGIYEE